MGGATAQFDPDHGATHQLAAEEVSASRLYAARHYPTDVHAGAEFGYSATVRELRTLVATSRGVPDIAFTDLPRGSELLREAAAGLKHLG